MTTCGSLNSLFEKPLPENPTLMESLSSWQNLMPKKPLDTSSFTEIFGELHFQEKPLTSTIFSMKTSESSLQLCTEGLGSESSDDVDDLVTTECDDQEFRAQFKEKMDLERREFSIGNSNNIIRSTKSAKEFPPPISSIGKTGKPAVCFKAFREEGRFVLREIRIPTQEYLRASRQDGRLKLQFICRDEEIVQGEEGEEENEIKEVEMEEKEKNFDGVLSV